MTTNPGELNVAIRRMYTNRWQFNGDLMTCQACGWSVIASRINERPGHAADCIHRNGPNPWKFLHAALSDMNLAGVVP